jgi:hypothetical protein
MTETLYKVLEFVDKALDQMGGRRVEGRVIDHENRGIVFVVARSYKVGGWLEKGLRVLEFSELNIAVVSGLLVR